MDTGISLLNYKDAVRILNNLNVPFFLSNGTFLGYRREGDFIQHDLDVDLGVLIENYRDDILESFLNDGFTIHKIYGEVLDRLEYSMMKREQKLDIFFYYNDGKQMWHGISNGDLHGRYVYPMTDFKKVRFHGSDVLIPEDTFLEAEYGDWKQVVKNWHWWNSPHNIQHQ